MTFFNSYISKCPKNNHKTKNHHLVKSDKPAFKTSETYQNLKRNYSDDCLIRAMVFNYGRE